MAEKIRRPENPLPDIVEASDAMAKIISLKTDLFLLNQELKTLRQLKRTLWLGASLLFLNLLFVFTFYWIEMALHERGWPSWLLAILSFVFFGICVAIFASMAFLVGKKTKQTRPT